jgi:hypothetical protein
MFIHKSHGTEERTRTYGGEEDCRALLIWLNDESTDAGRDRVRKILQLFNTIREYDEIRQQGCRRHGASSTSKDDFLRFSAFMAKGYDREVRELQRLLRRYQYYPLLLPFKNGSSWSPVPKGNKYAHGWAIEYDDANAVFDLAALAENELLTRLRKCTCGKWLFARFNHQRFCGAACREKEFRSSPTWKEYRRKKAREYYQLHKSGKVK